MGQASSHILDSQLAGSFLLGNSMPQISSPQTKAPVPARNQNRQAKPGQNSPPGRRTAAGLLPHFVFAAPQKKRRAQTAHVHLLLSLCIQILDRSGRSMGRRGRRYALHFKKCARSPAFLKADAAQMGRVAFFSQAASSGGSSGAISRYTRAWY